MNVIVVGVGRLGSQFAQTLASAGHTVTVVDLVDARLDALGTRVNVRQVTGDACEPFILEEAGVLAADLLVASTGDDEDNLVIALLAKRQFAVPRVAARVNDPDNTWLFDDRWGVDVAVSAGATLLSLIEEGTGATDTVGLLRLTHAGVNLIETVIRPQSKMVDRPLGEVRLPPGSVVAAVIRAGRPAVPDGSFRLRADDEVLVVAQTAGKQEIDHAFQ
jgi:trk system potassium uptake protein TrkA